MRYIATHQRATQQRPWRSLRSVNALVHSFIYSRVFTDYARLDEDKRKIGDGTKIKLVVLLQLISKCSHMNALYQAELRLFVTMYTSRTLKFGTGYCSKVTLINPLEFRDN